MTAPKPTVTTLEVMPNFSQSENRPTDPNAVVSARIRELIGTERAYYTYGLTTTGGSPIGPNGPGSAATDTNVDARGFLRMADPLPLAVNGIAQYARAAELSADDEDRGVVVFDSGTGGLRIEAYALDAMEPNGRNLRFWLEETARLCDEFDVAFVMPYLFHFQGTSAKSQPGSAYIAAWSNAYAPVAQFAGSRSLPPPRILMVANGGDVNTIGDLYDTPVVQYMLTESQNGILATWQRVYPIFDGNIHIKGDVKALIGETAAWAREVEEAGGAWSIWFSVLLNGNTITVDFDLLPDEVLRSDDGFFDLYGGDATCQNYGFETDVEILNVDLVNNQAIISCDGAPTMLRLAMQVQNVSGFAHEGVNYSAHRTTLYGSETRPSQFVEGEVLVRPVPSFRGIFNGTGEFLLLG